MTLDLNLDFSKWLLGQLVASGFKGGILAATAGVGLVLFKTNSTATRLLAWRIVLFGALAMPLLSLVLPPVQVPLPWIDSSTLGAKATTLAPDTRRAYVTSTTSQPREESTARTGEELDRVATVSPRQGSNASTTRISWSAIAIAVYFLVAAILLLRFVIGIALSRRLVRSSKAIDQSWLAEKIARSQSSGRCPQLAESDLIVVPLTVGIARPTILLPANWREWGHATFNSVLAHEMSHVARRDSLTQAIALLYRALFWFNPLSWWLESQLSDLAEQASDEAALLCAGDSNSYARTLLSFLEILQDAQTRVRWQGVCMVKIGSAERRIERILDWKGAVTMRLKKSAVFAAVTLAIPVIYVTASARPAARMQEPMPPTAPPIAGPTSALAPRFAPAAPGAPVSAPIALESRMPAAPFAPSASFAPVTSWSSAQNRDSSGSGFSYAYGDDDEDRYVIVSGKTDSMTMSGSSQDMRHVEKLKKQISGDFIWFQRDEKSYVIRDQATVDRARKFWFEQEELGKKQAELGAQQEALGKQQEELGSHMEKLQVKVPDMTADLDKLKAELKELSTTGATAEQVGRIQSEIGELQSKVGEVQSSAGDQQSKLGAQMSELGEKQSKLGEEQGKLGERQEAIAREASQKMKQLLDEALKNGTAQPESQNGGAGTI